MAKVLPTQIVIATFQQEDTADKVADGLNEALANGELFYKNLAIIKKDEGGKIQVRETNAIKAAPAAAAGGLLGGLALCLFGPVGVAAGAAGGAVLMGAAANSIETLNKEKMQQIGDVLLPQTSAIIAVFEEVVIPQSSMEKVAIVRDEIVYQIATDAGQSLRRGEDLALLFAVTDEGIVASRTAVGDEALNIQGLVFGPNGAVAGRVVATEDNIAYEVVGGQVVVVAEE